MNDWETEPFIFVNMILNMRLDIICEVFPEVGSVENIFKYYTYEEAKAAYKKWYNK